MPRELKYPGCQNSSVQVWALDEPGPGGAHHKYALEWDGSEAASGYRDSETGKWRNCCFIRFQNGPIKEAGINGATNEVLLAIVVDRLQSFQKGGFSCRENAIALTKIEEALHWMQHRTEARIARGVEGETKV